MWCSSSVRVPYTFQMPVSRPTVHFKGSVTGCTGQQGRTLKCWTTKNNCPMEVAQIHQCPVSHCAVGSYPDCSSSLQEFAVPHLPAPRPIVAPLGGPRPTFCLPEGQLCLPAIVFKLPGLARIPCVLPPPSLSSFHLLRIHPKPDQSLLVTLDAPKRLHFSGQFKVQTLDNRFIHPPVTAVRRIVRQSARALDPQHWPLWARNSNSRPSSTFYLAFPAVVLFPFQATPSP